MPVGEDETMTRSAEEPDTGELAGEQGAIAVIARELSGHNCDRDSDVTSAMELAEALYRAGYAIVPQAADAKIKNSVALSFNNTGKRWGDLYASIIALASQFEAHGKRLSTEERNTAKHD